MVIQICQARCAEMVPRVCAPMTMEAWVASYARIHEIVCDRFQEGRKAEMMTPLLTVIQGGRSQPEGDYLKEVFGDHGYLAQLFPGYKPRPGQIQLATAIDAAIRDPHHVIGEGPTGTGKSLAYLVPAAYHAVHHGKRVCVVTANKNLQRQIYQKDLADLARAVPWPFTYSIRKGISSYLCRRDLAKEKYRELLLETGIDQRQVEATVEWAKQTRTGDFEESPGPPPKVWSHFSTSREDCDGKKCRYLDECHVAEAKRRAAGAHITVTNYHLFFMHLAMGEGSTIFPPFDVVIFDEAHNAANIARDFFGTEISWGTFYRLVNKLHLVEVQSMKLRGTKLRDDFLAGLNRFWDQLAERARGPAAVFREDYPLDSEPFEQLIQEAVDFYAAAAAALERPAPQQDLFGSTSFRAAAPKAAAEADSYKKLAIKLTAKRDQIVAHRLMSDKGMVYFAEGGGGTAEGAKRVKLRSRAIEVGGFMRKMLFEGYPTVVQTSATLAVLGGGAGSFAFLRREMGMGTNSLHEDLKVDELVVESPFNWPKQALLVIPRSMPEFAYGNVDWDKAVCDHVEEVVNVMRGRTLGLFTSYRMLQMVRDRLRERTSWRVLVQGEATNRELATEFQQDVHSVLLGTESFAEGISIEGEACSCVVLDKIPFPHADDPVLQAIEARYKRRGGRESVFQTHMLPEAIISFKQRVGRLIRTIKDVGVVVVLDKRLLTKGYRRQFIQSIPPLRREEGLDAIKPFLREKGIT